MCEMKSQVGICWYSIPDNKLFGIYKEPPSDLEMGTVDKLHVDLWNETNDLPEDLTIPRIRVWHRDGGKEYFISCGGWINDHPQALDMTIKEFELPEGTQYFCDEHWDVEDVNKRVLYVTEEKYPLGGTSDIAFFTALRRNYGYSKGDYGIIGLWEGCEYSLVGFNPYKPKNSIRLKRVYDGVICVCDRNTADKIFER